MEEWANLLKSVDGDIVGDVEFVQGKWEAMGDAMVVKQGKELFLLSERVRKLEEEWDTLHLGRAKAHKRDEYHLLRDEFFEQLDFDLPSTSCWSGIR